ncbi:transporter : Cation/multidrug efflux pump OS=Singulisphaera acidiphila (strain ATCC BAA-1392 / DSM 18658 / VKM B-2454 / MOB10) GN=Sinac_7474 PE=4 SV=1: ACR_tran: ACR_tran [Tuwongella immobilis]|uniref:SSD domain-containing protein n=1 Tax=Tuwongella immobilis TaxID=692036 RepID=A0A6C2YQ31_9BACT|nr:efflux RND transporter permease subunit [Tuwongella immobilis]VIP03421.1 transporter : Cation/multidrug efflux pump OS=Singulisphaera acidiphila (strain ATCC BAA-1392 / DSM 18658 / VKM B-2454 / MOB10) GN=Sinac_7474 PE=4 SV=1: ACR_tran: ACR_tran [Tuwongella immobilis]VTS04214.1 transporter : Cation/multidrug efflux pump OS=Singulisphaera acidiphila (strain ATCC BAA-1392 / DSM 18658 / VKM B-2454 / MOB10) GN=Sinac_7474 PE=4 SV=1: ACR_tran: ACR_tran [Tuwongella immobilis]
MSEFFIRRPIFATVLSIVVTLIGLIALIFLPVSQYPAITPPGVSISISYPGASAREVANSVGAPIEQYVNGVPGMIYMSSQSGNDGSYSLTVTFEIGTDIKTALVMVQNRVALAMPQLPTAVQNQGIRIRKRTPDMLMIVNFISTDGRYDDKYLSNFATIAVRDELLRVDGISDINVFGQRDYSMRIWLDPQKLAARNLTALDVAAAIRSQNIDAPAGRIGQPPIANGQAFDLPLSTLGRLSDPDQFGEIVLKIGTPPTMLGPTGLVVERPNPIPAGRSIPTRGSGRPTPIESMPSPPPLANPATPLSGENVTASPSANPLSNPTAPSRSLATSAANSEAMSAVGSGMPSGGAASGIAATITGSEMIGGAAGANSLQSRDLGLIPSVNTPTVRLKDVARIEIGSQNYNTISYFDGQPTVGLGLYQLPGSNALDVASAVKAKMDELAKRFPDSVEYRIGYDTSTFVRDSVNDVVKTLFEALALVAVVVLVFLQSWRAAMIPLIAVPVAIIGTFAIMALLGYSLNNISLFGLVLAIGIVVDDAIVVVENVERWMDRGLSAREATSRAMEEVTGPILAVGVVLCAVFIPCAFIPGITGQFFQQFAITIAASTVISTVSALTLSPALSALLLRPRSQKRDLLGWILWLTLGWFFWLFNRIFGIGSNWYGWIIRQLLRVRMVPLILYGVLLATTIEVFRSAPQGFIPQQDQGRLIVNVQLPDSASLERTEEATLKIQQIAMETPGVAHAVSNVGISFLLQANSPNFASMFVVLKPFAERQSPALRHTAIMAKMRARWAKEVPEAQVTVFATSPIPGLGLAGGFKLILQDRAGMPNEVLQAQLDPFVERLTELPQVANASSQYRSNAPQLFLEVDRTKAAALGVPVSDIHQTLNMFLGSSYVNSYNDLGRIWQVTVQAEGAFRSDIQDVGQFQVRNRDGEMVPLSTLVRIREIGGPVTATRYNLHHSAVISGNVAAGFSNSDAIAAVDRLAAETLPRTMNIEWTDLFYQQIQAGDTAIFVFLLAVVSVFLALAGLYESWALPLAVILVVPLCLLCSVVGVQWSGRDVNIFVQIGLVVLVGLACKNSILIVEFAKHLQDQGMGRTEATLEAARQRLRPILMTSFAFIFGTFPLVVASGAGAEMRRSLGTAVFSGMLGVTLFGILLTPSFYDAIQRLTEPFRFRWPRFQAILSYTIGSICGGLFGFAVSKLGTGYPLVAVPIGATIAAIGVAVARQLRLVRQSRRSHSIRGDAPLAMDRDRQPMPPAESPANPSIDGETPGGSQP